MWLPVESLALSNFNVLQIIENWGFLDYGTRSGQFCGNWWRSSCFSAFHIHQKFLRQPSWQFEDGIPFNLSMSCLCKLWRVTKLKGWCFHSHERLQLSTKSDFHIEIFYSHWNPILCCRKSAFSFPFMLHKWSYPTVWGGGFSSKFKKSSFKVVGSRAGFVWSGLVSLWPSLAPSGLLPGFATGCLAPESAEPCPLPDFKTWGNQVKIREPRGKNMVRMGWEECSRIGRLHNWQGRPIRSYYIMLKNSHS